MQSTFEARLALTDLEFAVLAAQMEELSRLERKLFVDLYVRKLDRNLLKRRYIEQSGITARQFNALRINVQGKVAAWQEAEQRCIDTLTGKRKAAEKKVKTLQSKRGKSREAEERQRLAFLIHQKKRLIGNLAERICRHQQRLEGTPSICFGSRELFRQQFHLAENGYRDHADWRNAWRFKRSSQFLSLGSRGETLGSQTCQYDAAQRTLCLRLTAAAARLNGGNDRLLVAQVSFPHGQQAIEAAQQLGTAVASRLILRRSKGQAYAYALLSVDEEPAQIRTCRFNGGLGLDLNARSITLGWVKQDGNTERTATLPFDLGRKSSEQITSLLSALAQEVVMRASAARIPVIRERLDFGEKKKTLGESGARYAEMLSGFAYATFYRLLDRCAARHGVEVVTVNPAFTSVLGWTKFGVGRLTVDEAAAVAIARRGLGFTECLRSRSMSPALRTKLMQAAGERHMRHVWSGWRRFSQWLGKSRKDWSGRCSAKERSADASPAITSRSATGRKRRDLPNQPNDRVRTPVPASGVAQEASPAPI